MSADNLYILLIFGFVLGARCCALGPGSPDGSRDVANIDQCEALKALNAEWGIWTEHISQNRTYCVYPGVMCDGERRVNGLCVCYFEFKLRTILLSVLFVN